MDLLGMLDKVDSWSWSCSWFLWQIKLGIDKKRFDNQVLEGIWIELDKEELNKNISWWNIIINLKIGIEFIQFNQSD